MTGSIGERVWQVLAVDTGDAVTTRRALGIIAIIVLLSMGTISLTIG